MKFQYAPELVEEAVFQEIERRQEGGDVKLFKMYHSLADQIYGDFSGRQREEAFDRLHREFFVKLGFAGRLAQSLAEFERLSSHIEWVFVGKAISGKEEGADLSKDGKGLGVKLRTRRFFDPLFLERFLRHELTHIADMLDPQFGYAYCERLNPVSPAEDNLIRERYRALWDIYIDSRILRSGRETVSSKSQRFREFAALYQKLPDDWASELFEALWNTKYLTHGELLKMAQDIQQLLARAPYPLNAEDALIVQGTSQVVAQLPGSPCPLCRFPTYVWMTDVTKFTPQLLKLIQEDSPDWRPEHGMCERCFEGCQARTGFLSSTKQKM